MSLNWSQTWIGLSGLQYTAALGYGGGCAYLDLNNLENGRNLGVTVETTRCGFVAHASVSQVLGIVTGVTRADDAIGLTCSGFDFELDLFAIKLASTGKLLKLGPAAGKALLQAFQTGTKFIGTESTRLIAQGLQGCLSLDGRGRGFYIIASPFGCGKGGGIFYQNQKIVNLSLHPLLKCFYEYQKPRFNLLPNGRGGLDLEIGNLSGYDGGGELNKRHDRICLRLANWTSDNHESNFQHWSSHRFFWDSAHAQSLAFTDDTGKQGAHLQRDEHHLSAAETLYYSRPQTYRVKNLTFPHNKSSQLRLFAELYVELQGPDVCWTSPQFFTVKTDSRGRALDPDWQPSGGGESQRPAERLVY